MILVPDPTGTAEWAPALLGTAVFELKEGRAWAYPAPTTLGDIRIAIAEKGMVPATVIQGAAEFETSPPTPSPGDARTSAADRGPGRGSGALLVVVVVAALLAIAAAEAIRRGRRRE